VLLDDARAPTPGVTPEPARLYADCVETVVARHAHQVAPALDRLRALAQGGLHCAGYLGYEAGLALEPRLAARTGRRAGAGGPLLWFGAFSGCERIAAAAVPGWLAGAADGSAPPRLGPLEPQVSPGGYARGFARMAAAIAAGDIYQANLTFPLAGDYVGDEVALYAALRARAGGGHSALVYDGAHWTLSFSPELFFALHGDEITARPMKGTRPRGATPAEDAALVAQLVASAKDRAENLMIVDLLRNDLSRVAVPGSVRVADPFAVETYPTVHQMVTRIRARLGPGRDAIDVLRALFPCGSITGAPKIRAMELIDMVERDARGIYCGAIGHIGPADGGGDAGFNVAIRTLRLKPDGQAGGRAELGVGSAVVADSVTAAEWRESVLKGAFVSQSAPVVRENRPGHDTGASAPARFDLVETMAFSPDAGIPLIDLHLARLAASAGHFGFSFDRHAVRNAIQAMCFEAETLSRLRLVVSRSGAYTLEIASMPEPFCAPLDCVVLPLAVDSSDWRLMHKTSDRWFYEAGLRAAASAGAQEALLIRDDGLLTEGCFTNLFVARDGVLLTPPARLGLLPGVLRCSLIEAGRAREAELTIDDLAQGFHVGNALRGLMPARLG
jgi:para-aminobenzoate synthetase/4-amino-4-deoxychorismate lyase